MSPANNRIPPRVNSIHLIAACGTAMGALACLLKELGHRVTASDHQAYPPMSRFLARNGIVVAPGFRPRHLDYGPDLVVVGNAVSRDNPEVVRMLDLGLDYCSMPQAVNHFLGRGREALVVVGTHGKTTTAALLAWVLHHCGCDPSFMVGGILKNFDSNYRLGQGAYLVLEGDEYDTAYFDKAAKFFHYPPRVAMLTSVEFDHADIFTDLDHIRRTFGRFVAGIPPRSLLVACQQDPEVLALCPTSPCPVETYGTDPGALWSLGAVTPKPCGQRFEILKGASSYATFDTPMVGTHNLLNTLAVVACADHLGLARADIGAALNSFGGVHRRQELRGSKRGVRVMDDFAHHPTAVRETLRAVKPLAAGGRLIAVFEPRTNTSMRDIFQTVYPTVFEPADLVCVRQPPRLDKIPSELRFSSRRLVADLRRRGQTAHFFEDTEGIIDLLAAEARRGDLILVMSNGGFDNIHERLLDAL